jgi:hypothetical protein
LTWDLGLNPAPLNLSFTLVRRDAFTRIASRDVIGLNGDRSSMVELQFVVLAVAGSSPVGRPSPLSRNLQELLLLGIGFFRGFFEIHVREVVGMLSALLAGEQAVDREKLEP